MDLRNGALGNKRNKARPRLLFTWVNHTIDRDRGGEARGRSKRDKESEPERVRTDILKLEEATSPNLEREKYLLRVID